MCGDKIESIKENWVGWQCTLFLSNEIIWSLTFLAQNKIASFLWHKFLDNSMCDVPKSWEFRKFRFWCYVVLVRVSNFLHIVVYPWPYLSFKLYQNQASCSWAIVLHVKLMLWIWCWGFWKDQMVGSLLGKQTKQTISKFVMFRFCIQHDCWKHKNGNSRFCFKQLALFLLDTLLRLVILNFFVLSCFSIFQ